MNLLLSHLLTEERNPASMRIDLETTEGMLRIINQEDQKVATAVAAEIPQIAKAVDLVTEAFRMGGRLFYVGAGTSGRLGILDASECPPTFNVSHELVQGVMAGGMKAAVRPVEASEDSEPRWSIRTKETETDRPGRRRWHCRQRTNSLYFGSDEVCKEHRGKGAEHHVQSQFEDGRLGRCLDCAGAGTGSGDGIDPNEIGDCAKAGAQYDHDGQHDQTRLRV